MKKKTKLFWKRFAVWFMLILMVGSIFASVISYLLSN